MKSSYQLLKKYGIRPKKGLGQNFLVDPNHLQKIVETAELSAGDIVLEVGPGLGALTACLVEQVQAVVAVEFDRKMVNVLTNEIRAGNFYLIQADILAIDPATVLQNSLPHFTPGDDYIVVANLPYYITSAVIRHFLEAPFPPRRMILTVQKEVGQRITAKPGKMSLLAVSVQFYGHPKLCHTIPPNAFYPSPKVDSAVLRLNRRPAPLVSGEDSRQYFRVVKAGFNQKRKQLKNSLAAGLHRSQAEVTRLMESVGVDPRRRAETLSLEEWVMLAKVLEQGVTR